MINKIKRSLTANIGLKAAACVLSFFLWLVIVNVDDPNTTKTFTASVNVINEETLLEQGKYYTVPDGSYTISFRVTAKRSIIEKLSNSDFTATADMNYLDVNQSRVPIEITANTYASSITLSAKAYYLTVEVGDIQSNNFVIQGVTKGTPASGCTVKSVQVTPNVISVTGPDSIVSTIDKVKAVADVTGFNGDISETVVPTFYDAAGNEIDTTQLNLSVASVTVSIDMASTKTVPLVVETTGSVANGYEVKSVTYNPNSISIMGESTDTAGVNNIIIPEGVVDISNLSETTEFVVDITAYLPNGVSLIDSDQTQITITVNIGKVGEGTMNSGEASNEANSNTVNPFTPTAEATNNSNNSTSNSTSQNETEETTTSHSSVSNKHDEKTKNDDN